MAARSVANLTRFISSHGTPCNAPSVEQHDCDDSSFVEADGDGLLGHHEAMSYPEDETAVVGKVLYPTLSSCGKFVGYEVDSDVYSQPTKPSNSKKYAAMFALLLFFVGSVSAIYLAGSNSFNPSSEPVDQENSHPQKEHTPRHADSPTTGPTMMPRVFQTYPQNNDHEPRHSESPITSPSSDTLAHTSLADYESDLYLSNQRSIAPIAVSTVRKSHPDDKAGGLQELAVERDERISFIRFDLSSWIPYDNDVVVQATLCLHLKTHSGEQTTVSVSMLPHGGEWIDQSVSWNNPPNSKESYSVTTFDVAAGGVVLVLPDDNNSGSGTSTQLIEVDVSSAVNYEASTQNEWVTFKLDAESSGDLWFASKRWNGGEAVPELVITIAA